METTHRFFVGDARDLSNIDDNGVELVVTSPPYPMIEMWDEMFAEFDSEIERALAIGDGELAFDRMHDVLAPAWAELSRVLVNGGIACINVGDATRSIDGRFRKFPNAARIAREMRAAGFDPLPDILWRKPTNAGTKFMGSGMLPPNAYVTLEHEYVLIFRNKSSSRSFDAGAERRYTSAYFWEERNQWFSDVWEDLLGTDQADHGAFDRDRSGAFPLELPYRLINMYSVYGDTVLDPFFGTGTTSLASMVAARNSIGVDTTADALETIASRVGDVQPLARRLGCQRLEDHTQFVTEHRQNGGEFRYEMEYYEAPVKTAQEQRIRLYSIEEIGEIADGYRVRHAPIDNAE